MKRRIRIAAASVMVAAGLIGAVAAPASAKKRVKNPLAGTYVGSAETLAFIDGPPGGVTRTYPLRFTITKSGQVVGLSLPTVIDCEPGVPFEQIPGVISAPSLRLSKPTKSFPRGKRFDYTGPGGSPAGTVEIKGKPDFRYDRQKEIWVFAETIHGLAWLGDAQIDGRTCLDTHTQFGDTIRAESAFFVRRK